MYHGRWIEREDLASLITSTARRVRTRDFAWIAGIIFGISLGAMLFVVLVAPIAPWWAPVVAYASFMAALAIRYRFSSGRDWAQPVQRAVATELSAAQAELLELRLVRGIAQSLPEPLFILEKQGMIELANPAAEEFLGQPDLEGRHIAGVLRAPDVYEAVEKIIAGSPPHAVDFTTLGDVVRSCRAFVAPLNEQNENDDGRRVLVFIRDLTSERRVEKMRADFIASASHELRTPLASLIGFIDTLRGHAKGDEKAREKFLTIMHAQAERMQRLVADLMSLSRIELNEHVPPGDTVDLDLTVRDVIESLTPLFDKSEAIVDYEGPGGEAVRILGDRDEIVQAVQNLLDNAVKYGGSPAMVKVRVGMGRPPALSDDGELSHRAGDTAAQLAARQSLSVDLLAYVQVQDFGPGIERAAMPRLTERFYRANVERSRKSGGTGLGLAIVKHIANRHKGALHVESRLAAGAIFTCLFPAAPREQQAVSAASVFQRASADL